MSYDLKQTLIKRWLLVVLILHINVASPGPSRAAPRDSLPPQNGENPIPQPELEDGEANICTFQSFKDPDKLPPVPLNVLWPGSQTQIDEHNLSVTVQASVRDVSSKTQVASTTQLKAGSQIVPLSVSNLISGSRSFSVGFTKLPLFVQVSLRDDPRTGDNLSSTEKKRIDLCSFADLKERHYRILLSDIPTTTTKQAWFKWSKLRQTPSYQLTLVSVDLLQRLSPLLATARIFSIETQNLERAQSNIFFLRHGEIVASLQGAEPKKAGVSLLTDLLDADLAFEGDGESFLPLEESMDSRMITINRVLRSHEEIYLLLKNRVVPVRSADVTKNASLLRAYLPAANGLFTKPPKIW